MMNLIPWNDISREDKLEFININLSEKRLNKIVNKLYKRKNVILNPLFLELKEKYLTFSELLPDCLKIIILNSNYIDLTNLSKVNKTIRNICININFRKKYICNKINTITIDDLKHIKLKNILKLEEILFSPKYKIKSRSIFIHYRIRKYYDETYRVYEKIKRILYKNNIPIQFLGKIYANNFGYKESWKEVIQIFRSFDMQGLFGDLNALDIYFGGDTIALYILENDGLENFFKLSTSDLLFKDLFSGYAFKSIKYILDNSENINLLDNKFFLYKLKNPDKYNIEFIYSYFIKEKGIISFIKETFILKVDRLNRKNSYKFQYILDYLYDNFGNYEYISYSSTESESFD